MGCQVLAGSYQRPATGRNSGTINFLKGRVNQNGNDTRKTEYVHFAIHAAHS